MNTTRLSDISKLLYVISRAVRWVKFETILKYREWYLRQISGYYLFLLLPPWVRTFFLKSPETEFFSSAYNIVRLLALRDIFSVQDMFSPGISLQEYFFSQVSVQDIFFWNHPYPPPNLPCKSQMFGPLGNHHCWEHREWLVVNITWQLIDSLYPNLVNGKLPVAGLKYNLCQTDRPYF